MAESKKPRRTPGSGGVYQQVLKNGEIRWFFKCTVTVGGVKKPILRRGFKTKRDAEKALREALQQSDQGLFVDPGKVTVSEWLTQWHAGLRVSEGTLITYERVIRINLTPRIGDVKLSKLTSTRINQLYRELESSGSARNKPLKPRTIRLIAKVLKMALHAAVEAEPPLLARNPASKATLPLLDDDPSAIKAWTDAQVDRFMTWADENDPENAFLWRFAVATGMRRGELLGLEWRDVNGDVAVVRRSAQPRNDGRVVVGPTKSRKTRAVALDDETLAGLKAWRVKRASLNLDLVRDTAPIFGGVDGKHIDPETVTMRFARAVERCQEALGTDVIPRVTLHGLRHTMVTTWLTAGVPVKVVAERTGHSVTMMMEVYAHVLPGSQAAAAKQVAALRRRGRPASDETRSGRSHLRAVEGETPGQQA